MTLAAPVNHVTVNASAAGFASAWVDWNEDGDFADAGERVADAQAVTAGNNDLTFPGAANPANIQTYVRVRYSTDAASIHAPTGAAPDGEVEDYQVLVERLIMPSACAAITDPYYAITASSITDHLNTGLNNETARYPAVAVVGGVPVDLLAAVTAGHLNAAGFSLNGNDPSWILGTATASVKLSFVVAGTTTPGQRQQRLPRQRHGQRRGRRLPEGRCPGRRTPGREPRRHHPGRDPLHLQRHRVGHQRPAQSVPGVVQGQERR